MAYSKHRYESRQEKRARIARNTKVVVAFAAIALAVLTFKNRVYIFDMLRYLF